MPGGAARHRLCNATLDPSVPTHLRDDSPLRKKRAACAALLLLNAEC
jgi:hypothetical protein